MQLYEKNMIATWNTWNKAITNEFKQSMGE